jgi:hypothetical protein
MENTDTPKEDRHPQRFIRMDLQRLGLLWQKQAKTNEVIRRAEAALAESIALIKRIGNAN